MSDNRDTIERSRRHHQAETHRQTVHLPGQTNGHPGSGGGSDLIWATVNRSLLYPDPEAVSPIPVEGYSYYIFSLDGVADWASGQAVVVGDMRNNGTTHDTYVCTTSHTTATEPTRDSHTNWEFFKAIPTCQEHEGNTNLDMRLFSPWFDETTDRVPLILVDGDYYFAQQMTRTGTTSGHRSRMWHPTEHRDMSVFRDVL